MNVKLIENTEDFLKLQGYWNDILKKSYANFPFLTFEWLSSWWKSFGAGKRLFVMTVNENNHEPLHGIAPMMLVKSTGFRIIEFIGTGRSDFLDFIIKDKIDDTIKAFFTFLNEYTKRWDVIFLSDILLDGGSIERLRSAAKDAGWYCCSRLYCYSPYLPINNAWPEFLSSKSAHFQKSVKNAEKLPQREGMKFHIRQINAKELEPQIIQEIVAIEENSWKFDTGVANIHGKSAQIFFSDFLQNFAKKEWLNLWIGYLDDKPAVFIINFDYGEKIWFYNVTSHKEGRRYGLGFALLHHVIRNAFLREKAEYDFMRGMEPYKLRWTSSKRESFQLVFYKKTFRSWIGFLFIFRLRWFLAKYRMLREVRFYFMRHLRNLKNRLSY